MMTPTLTATAVQIKPFDGKRASDTEMLALNRFWNLVNAERMPDDPPVPLDETIGDYRNLPAVYDEYAWVVWNADETEIVGMGDAWFKTTDENTHLLEITLDVLPAYRRRGIARELLARLAEVAVRERRRLMLARTYERVPEGAALMRKLDAQVGSTGHVNQLDLRALDRSLVERSSAQARERAADFELLEFEGAYPDELLEALAELFNVMNTAPRDNLDMQDWRSTPEQLRQFEDYLVGMGKQRSTMVARHVPTGELAGFTTVCWSPQRAEVLKQWGTGVLPKFRNRGLGRWLKAAMLDKALREHPQLRLVRTDNADSNAPMLKINHELGFKPYAASTTWQLETDKVLIYLDIR